MDYGLRSSTKKDKLGTRITSNTPKNNYSVSSNSSTGASNNESYSDEEEEEMPVRQRRKEARDFTTSSPTKKKFSETNYKFTVKGVVFAVVAVGVVAVGIYFRKYFSDIVDSSQKCRISPKSVSMHFPNQESTIWEWMNTLNEADTSGRCALILYQSNVEKTVDCLTSKMASSLTCLSKNDIKTVSASDLLDDEYGSQLERIREDMQNVLIFKDANEIQSAMAQIFHSLCDVTGPFLTPSVYFLTVPTPHNVTSGREMAREARLILSDAWAGLPKHLLDPLITRVMSYIFFARHEPNLPC